MLPLDDPRWKTLHGAYRRPFDASRALRQIYARENGDVAWSELWNELHHQGDVDAASYAVVPHVVQILKTSADIDLNGYAFVATVELERHRRKNPPIPVWMQEAYDAAWNELLPIALRDYANATDPLTSRAILGALALCKGLRTLGELAATYDESEIQEILENS